MAITNKEIFQYVFGITDETEINAIDSIDKFKEKFHDKKGGFVSRAELVDTKSDAFREFVPNAVGLVAGKSVTALKKRLTEMGIEFNADEIKDKPLEEIIDLTLGRAANDVKTKFGDYENRIKLNSTDATKEWESKLNKISSEHGDLKKLHDSLKNQYNIETTKYKAQLKGMKTKHVVDQYHKDNLKFKSGITDLERDGYFSRINSKYKVALNESGTDLDVFDANGKRIPNTKQAGTWMTYKDVLENEGVTNNVWATSENARKMNNQQNNQTKNIEANNQQNQNQNGQVDTLRKGSSRFS